MPVGGGAEGRVVKWRLLVHRSFSCYEYWLRRGHSCFSRELPLESLYLLLPHPRAAGSPCLTEMGVQKASPLPLVRQVCGAIHAPESSHRVRQSPSNLQLRPHRCSVSSSIWLPSLPPLPQRAFCQQATCTGSPSQALLVREVT